MNKLQIGWSEIDITPDKKVSLAGQFAERISEYVEKPITATAMSKATTITDTTAIPIITAIFLLFFNQLPLEKRLLL